ncbi:MAG TPA: ATP-binding protein [Streptosporangiaceae bacterium]|nr:ATP-binding protein [Streptosporangiaceae bacterium]
MGPRPSLVSAGTAVVALDAEPPSVTAWWPLSSCLPLGALATAPPCARLHARAVLAEWGLGSVSEAAELIVSELVTNAVRISADAQRQHGGEAGVPVVIVRLAAGWDRVLVEVWDSFTGGPLIGRGRLDDESGRGLLLVEAVCDRWGWRPVRGRPGKVVWAELCHR